MKEHEIMRMRVSDRGHGQDIVLTSERVYQKAEKGIFGSAELSIPLRSVTAIRWGWKRFGFLLLLGGLLVALGLLVPLSNIRSLREGYLIFLGGGIMSLAFFWLAKPSGVEVHSTRVAITGQPVSPEEGREFISALNAAIAEYVDRRERSGITTMEGPLTPHDPTSG